MPVKSFSLSDDAVKILENFENASLFVDNLIQISVPTSDRATARINELEQKKDKLSVELQEVQFELSRLIRAKDEQLKSEESFWNPKGGFLFRLRQMKDFVHNESILIDYIKTANQDFRFNKSFTDYCKLLDEVDTLSQNDKDLYSNYPQLIKDIPKRQPPPKNHSPDLSLHGRGE